MRDVPISGSNVPLPDETPVGTHSVPLYWRDKSNLRENRLGSSVEVAKYAILCSAMVFRSLPLFDKCGASVKLCLRLIFDYLLIRSMHIAHWHISGVDGLLRCVVIVVVMVTFKFGIRWQQF